MQAQLYYAARLRSGIEKTCGADPAAARMAQKAKGNRGGSRGGGSGGRGQGRGRAKGAGAKNTQAKPTKPNYTASTQKEINEFLKYRGAEKRWKKDQFALREQGSILFASTAEAQADAAIAAGTLTKKERKKYIKRLIQKQHEALEERLRKQKHERRAQMKAEQRKAERKERRYESRKRYRKRQRYSSSDNDTESTSSSSESESSSSSIPPLELPRK
eukprot:SAG31_NODE_15280_length_762_cov_1.687783_1_plen_216_part_10